MLAAETYNLPVVNYPCCTLVAPLLRPLSRPLSWDNTPYRALIAHPCRAMTLLSHPLLHPRVAPPFVLYS